MMESLSIIAGALILVVALSLDAFAAGVAFGSDRVQVPWQSAFLISLVGSLFLILSLAFGKWIQMQIPAVASKYISVGCLLALGVWRLLDYRIKTYINHHQKMQKKIHFSISRLRFLITIYGNPVAADEDSSRFLSASEAITVAAVMSLDSLVAGIGALDWHLPVLPVFVLALLVGGIGVLSGCRLGAKLARIRSWDLSWIGGVILITLALWNIH